MNLLERVLTLLRANLDSVVEKSDDPEKALRRLQLDMRNQLVQVKTEVAKAIAESHTLQKRGSTRKSEADGWLKKAEQAVQQGNDDQARSALTHYNELNRLAQRYQQQKKEQEQLVTTLRDALRQLEAKLTEVDTTLELLATRKRNALLQQRVLDALNKAGDPADGGALTRAQETMLESEARAQARAQLHYASDQAQLDRLIAEQEIEQQLQQIKGQRAEAHRTTLNSKPKKTGESRKHTTPLANSRPREEARRRERDSEQKLDALAEPSTEKDLDLEYLNKLLDASQGSDH